MYAPNDGYNRGKLACTGARYTREQVHIALRKWRHLCGAPAIVCTRKRCAVAHVMDSGPWGAKCGKRFRVITGRLPQGCRRRAVVDLSYGLWEKVGKPGGLCKVWVFVLSPSRRSPLIVPFTQI